MQNTIRTTGAEGAPAGDFMPAGQATMSGKHLQTIHRVPRVCQLMVGLTTGLLLLRFVIALFGLDQANKSISAVMMLTEPLVVPFHTMFNQTISFGAARFEFDTLAAVAAYVLAGSLIVWFFRLTHNSHKMEEE